MLFNKFNKLNGSSGLSINNYVTDFSVSSEGLMSSENSSRDRQSSLRNISTISNLKCKIDCDRVCQL